jgi:hypothetical protein
VDNSLSQFLTHGLTMVLGTIFAFVIKTKNQTSVEWQKMTVQQAARIERQEGIIDRMSAELTAQAFKHQDELLKFVRTEEQLRAELARVKCDLAEVLAASPPPPQERKPSL